VLFRSCHQHLAGTGEQRHHRRPFRRFGAGIDIGNRGSFGLQAQDQFRRLMEAAVK
jgi:hypothetical protein